MNITSFAASRFRNLTQVELEPCPGVNVIYGENGQGKTNLIESVWLFTGCRSFRMASAAPGELIQHGEERAQLSAAFISNEREQSAELTLTNARSGEPQRSCSLNGFPQETPRRMLGVFPAVAFSPATLSLSQGGPAERRRFLDIALSMLRPVYAVTLAKYNKALAQRNALLRKACLEGSVPGELFLSWEEALAKAAAAVMAARREYLLRLEPQARSFYAGISGGREALSLQYQSSGLTAEEWACAGQGELAELYKKRWESGRRNDIRRQITSVGPHRDELLLSLDGRSLRSFGSQGQQRSCALALKLGEASVLRELARECPVALLDDVMSELDARRQADLLGYLEGWQVFLSCCEPSHLLHGRCGKAFEVKQGNVKMI
ncbi:MAG: DNA replication/repair protein RecF [Oscillospiraceae bacterium]|nr:DNA replication/repair protein RecF [Oscillospiraceae bacterium]